METPFSFDSFASALQSGALNAADVARYAASSRAVPWTPTLARQGIVGLGPVPAAGSSSGFYIVHNNMMIAPFSFRFAAGSYYGSGPGWLLSTPVTISTTSTGFMLHCGFVNYRHASTGQITPGWMQIDQAAATSGYVDLLYGVTGSALNAPLAHGFVSTTTPWTWADSDAIWGIQIARIPDGINPAA